MEHINYSLFYNINRWIWISRKNVMDIPKFLDEGAMVNEEQSDVMN